MDYTSAGQPDNRQKIIVGVVVAVLVIAIAVMAVVIIRRRAGGGAATPPVSVNPGQNQNVNGTGLPPVSSDPQSGVGTGDAPGIPPLPESVAEIKTYEQPKFAAGLNRPMTAEEKKLYGYPPNRDIWIVTSTPTDGTDPQVRFETRDASPTPPDADKDGYSDELEKRRGTDPNKPDIETHPDENSPS